MEEIDSKKSLLTQFGVIKGVEFDYSKNVLRGEFAKYITNLVYYGEDYSLEKGHFDFVDVTTENEYYSAIAVLINNGVVIGVGEGYFKPDDEITLNQACAIAVRLMGYDLYKMPEDENNVFYWSKANEMKLLKGINANNTDILTNEQAVILLFNMLEANVVKMSFTENKTFLSNEDTFLNQYMNLGYVEGVVSANSKTGLYSGKNAVGQGHIEIDGQNYILDNVGNIDEYLGKKVRLYYDASNTVEAKAIYVLDKYNQYTVVNADMIDRYDETSGKLYYYEDSSNKEESILVNMNASIIFNGVAVDYEHNKKYLFEPDVGEIQFIDNNRDSQPDVIFINSYVYYKVSQINSEMPVLYDALGIQPDMRLDSDSVEIYNGSEMIPISDLKIDSLIMAAPSRADFKLVSGQVYMLADINNSDYIKLETTRDFFDGTVKGHNLTNDKINIDGEEYSLSKVLSKTSKVYPGNANYKIPPIGSLTTVYFDNYGNIAYFKVASYAVGLKYGYVKKIVLDEESDEERYIARIFTEDGEHISVNLLKKVKVFKKWNDSAELSDTSYYGKRITDEALANLNGGTFNRQMVKFSLNDEGMLKELYIADTSNTRNTIGGKNLDFYVGDNVFMKGYSSVGLTSSPGGWQMRAWFEYQENATVYFKIPKSSSAGEAEYSTSKSQLFNNFTDVEYYDISEAGQIGCAVQYIESATKTGLDTGVARAMILLSNLEEVWDEKRDEVVYSAEVYVHAQTARTMLSGVVKTVTFAVSDMNSFEIDSVFEGALMENSAVPISSLKRGDLIYAYIDDSTNVINGFMVIDQTLGRRDGDGKPIVGSYLVSMAKSGSSYYPYDGITQSAALYVKGKVVKNVDDYKFYIDDGSTYRKHDLRAYQFNKDLVVIYDVKKQNVVVGTYSDIREGDYLAVFYDYFAVIVRNY